MVKINLEKCNGCQKCISIVKNSKLHIGKAMMKLIIALKRKNVKLLKRLIVNSSKHGFRIDGSFIKLST